MEIWSVEHNLPPEVASYFGSLEGVFSLNGTCVSRDRMSDVLCIDINGNTYFVKRYYHAGNIWRKFLCFPRVMIEWRNLKRFHQWQIPTAAMVAHGLQYKKRFFYRGAIVTAAIPKTQDLASIATDKPDLLRNRQWINNVSQQLADITRRLHQHSFAHNDLKWRNILVDQSGKVFIIDCPNGLLWIPPFLQHRIIKDLACLDKMAKYYLSRTQRLRFYLQYAQSARLSQADKLKIRKILAFFVGRE